MKLEIKSYIGSLDSKKLGLRKKPQKISVSKLGMGSSNLNYLVSVDGKKFVFRIDMQFEKKNKILNEYNSLKALQHLDIAPRPILVDTSRSIFDSDLLILEYVEGIPTNKVKPVLADWLIKKIAKLLAKVHSAPIGRSLVEIKKSSSTKGYGSYLDFMEKVHTNYIYKKLRNKELKQLIRDKSHELRDYTSKFSFSPFVVLSQGDFCQQNIIVKNNKLHLIDFESTQLTDAASEISHIFCTFRKPFSMKQRAIFLKEYKRNMGKVDPNLQQKIDVWYRIVFFEIFIWSVRHVLRSIAKDIHKDFLKDNDVSADIKYSNTMFNRCLNHGIIDKSYSNLNITKILQNEKR
jgi:aminoglycoside phosphotransferase (APT) family kinase protein